MEAQGKGSVVVETPEVGKIDAAIAAAEEDLAKRQGELEAAKAKVVEVESLYDLRSVEAINYNDPAAKKWLSQADKELFAAQAGVRQLTAAVNEIGERIAQLESDKVAAIRAGIEQQITWRLRRCWPMLSRWTAQSPISGTRRTPFF